MVPSQPPHDSLRPSVPQEPPAEQEEQPEHDGGRDEGTPAECGSHRLRGTHLNAIEVQEPSKGSGARPGPNPGNRISLQTHLCGEARDSEGFVSAAGRLGAVGGEGARRKETTSRPQAGEIYDNPIPCSPNVNVFSVNGQLEIGENFEGKGHVERGRIRER